MPLDMAIFAIVLFGGIFFGLYKLIVGGMKKNRAALLEFGQNNGLSYDKDAVNIDDLDSPAHSWLKKYTNVFAENGLRGSKEDTIQSYFDLKCFEASSSSGKGSQAISSTVIVQAKKGVELPPFVLRPAMGKIGAFRHRDSLLEFTEDSAFSDCWSVLCSDQERERVREFLTDAKRANLVRIRKEATPRASSMVSNAPSEVRFVNDHIIGVWPRIWANSDKNAPQGSFDEVGRYAELVF